MSLGAGWQGTEAPANVHKAEQCEHRCVNWGTVNLHNLHGQRLSRPHWRAYDRNLFQSHI